ncbi:MAG: hypothetical protein HQM12_17595 [SAR324 cluster bacterium]|nr:hypothetical protein [SAR324 cluster bacterium]
MNLPHKQYFPLKLSILTPVSVGNGETIDAMKYTIVEQDGKHYLHYLDLEHLLSHHPKAVELTKLLEQGRYEGIRKVIHELATQSIDDYSTGHRLVQDSIAKKFNSEINSANSPNQLLIDEALKNPLTQRLLVPGSSIKGAIRTAIIDHLDIEKKLGLNRGDFKEFSRNLENLLGRVGDNAFQALKIGDFEAALNEGVVMRAEEIKKNPDKQATPKNNREMTLSALTTGKIYNLFSSASLGTPRSRESKQKLYINSQKSGFDWTQICEITTAFYKKRFEDEFEKFYQLPHLNETAEKLRSVRAMIHAIKPDNGEMLIRIGHYSHIECMSITNNRPQVRKSKDNKPMGPGTTRTLADGLYPFGWVILSMASDENLEHYRKTLDQEWNAFLQEREHKKLMILKAREQAELERKQKEEQRLKREQEEREQQEQTRLEAERQVQIELERRQKLGWVGRYLEDVQQEKIKPNEIVTFMESADLLPPHETSSEPSDFSLKQKLAQDIVAYWEKSWGKEMETWRKKDIQKVEQAVGLQKQISAVQMTWPSEKTELKQLLDDDTRLQSFDKIQLLDLKRFQDNKLDNKEAKSYGRKLQKMINSKR